MRAGEGTAVRDPLLALAQKWGNGSIVLSQNNGRSRNDEALAHAREIIATINPDMHGTTAGEGSTRASDPAVLAMLLGKRFDQTAVLVAAWCALLARCEGSDASYETWKQVFARLHEATPTG
ncbi:hypothetical protein [Mesorhizobium sp. DCY119]|uniref:hypothetical protein n=1 Tax=Mesorhizobium sp. DCY119 TaxID=2108445 RepID=UPI000E761EC5|nr:hypothetical protein [Mesorhizobium sp. DCY119]RJG40895.1 hypothetical protein D3Y55_27110 [Mesorhizobium sp. DCY119]